MVCALVLFGYVKNRKFTIFFALSLLLALFSLYMVEQLEIINVRIELVERILSIFQTKENLERLYTWHNSLDMIKDYPLTGIGKRNFSYIVAQYRIPYGDFDFTSRAHAHNNLLQVAVESGIPALGCFLWLWIVMFRTMYRTYQQLHAQGSSLAMLALGCLGALLAFFVQGGFEHNFGDSEAAMMMWTIMAVGMKLSDLAFQSSTPVK
jgi:O-antigen ligase